MFFIGTITAHAGDCDDDRSNVGVDRMLGPLFQIERLVDRSVEIEQKMNTQAATVMQNIETVARRSSNVVMQHKLINDFLQKRQIPTPTANLLQLFRRQLLMTNIVTIWRIQIRNLFLGFFPTRILQRTKSALDPISVVTIRIHPQNNRRTDPKQLASGNDFVTVTFYLRSRNWRNRTTTGEESKRKPEEQTGKGKEFLH